MIVRIAIIKTYDYDTEEGDTTDFESVNRQVAYVRSLSATEIEQRGKLHLTQIDPLDEAEVVGPPDSEVFAEPPFKKGDRMRSIATIDRFAEFRLTEVGLLGTVTELTQANMFVKLDKHFDELNEWDNCVICPTDQGPLYQPTDEFEKIVPCTVCGQFFADDELNHVGDKPYCGKCGRGL